MSWQRQWIHEIRGIDKKTESKEVVEKFAKKVFLCKKTIINEI
jgi:hypothetical protein